MLVFSSVPSEVYFFSIVLGFRPGIKNADSAIAKREFARKRDRASFVGPYALKTQVTVCPSVTYDIMSGDTRVTDGGHVILIDDVEFNQMKRFKRGNGGGVRIPAIADRHVFISPRHIGFWVPITIRIRQSGFNRHWTGGHGSEEFSHYDFERKKWINIF